MTFVIKRFSQSPSLKLMAYRALVLPHLDYVSALIPDINSNVSLTIERVQYRFLRSLYPTLISYNALISQSNLNPLWLRRQAFIIKTFSCFPPPTPTHDHNLRSPSLSPHLLLSYYSALNSLYNLSECPNTYCLRSIMLFIRSKLDYSMSLLYKNIKNKKLLVFHFLAWKEFPTESPKLYIPENF